VKERKRQELYQRYRPKRFKDVLGQEKTVKVLLKKVASGKVPHAIMFSGPSGCGKTTLARILSTKLKCKELREVNAASFRGIDLARTVEHGVKPYPMKGGARVWIIDEVHQTTKECQNALLKTLEDMPAHSYVFLCTTEPNKLLKTVRNRCTKFEVRRVDPGLLEDLIRKVASDEGKVIPDVVCDKIHEYADGSPRQVLVLLDKITELEDEDDMLEAIKVTDVEKESIELARKLIQPKPKWGDVKGLVKEFKERKEDVEEIRRIVLAYMASVMLGGGPLAKRAFQVYQTFMDPWYDTGTPGLVFACYTVCQGP
jgi:DNA polymerase III subunit gamma/tau